MRYYPVFLRVEGRPCLVIGGGEIAERKVASLLAAGASVTVVSPTLTAALRASIEAGQVTHHHRPYRSGDLDGFFLAYAATNDDSLHAEIAVEAHATGVPLNVVDRPQWCDFIVPSTLSRGDLTVAVSTAGGSPALARRVRREIEALIGPEYEQALTLLRSLRQRLQAAGLPVAERGRILNDLVDSDLLECLRAGDTGGVERILARLGTVNEP